MDWCYEDECSAEGYKYICGTDEAGRGPLCGPVVAAAVILSRGIEIPYLNDSKKLSPKRREQLYDIITQNSQWAVGHASPDEIDALNILNASQLAMRRAVDGIEGPVDFVLIDGNVSREFRLPTRTIVGGDGKSPSIAAASIIAKVTRDRLMCGLDAAFPTLGLAKHKGYPTPEHYAALNAYIDAHGAPPEIYRLSFLKNLHRDV